MTDFFISHASEDKETFVKTLANKLLNFGATVFYDEYSIELGDSISSSINKGISTANFGIIVLSKFFFEKSWTNVELQSLFNKSLRKEFKLFIIYHNVTHEEVAEKYPLLADIKSLNSSIGAERVAIELLSAIDKKSQIAVLTGILEDNDIGEGISVSMQVSIPQFFYDDIDKVIFEAGDVNSLNSRIKIYLFKNKRLYFELTDSDYHKYSVSIPWKEGDKKFIVCNIDVVNKLIYFMVDGLVLDEIKFQEFKLDKNAFIKSSYILGCSLELTNQSKFILGTLILGKSLNIDEAIKLSEIFETYLKAIGRT